MFFIRGNNICCLLHGHQNVQDLEGIAFLAKSLFFSLLLTHTFVYGQIKSMKMQIYVNNKPNVVY